jgi:hypothetical protein
MTSIAWVSLSVQQNGEFSKKVRLVRNVVPRRHLQLVLSTYPYHRLPRTDPFVPSLSIRTIIKGCEDGYICAVAPGI